jgi:hypothetical protein
LGLDTGAARFRPQDARHGASAPAASSSQLFVIIAAFLPTDILSADPRKIPLPANRRWTAKIANLDSLAAAGAPPWTVFSGPMYNGVFSPYTVRVM